MGSSDYVPFTFAQRWRIIQFVYTMDNVQRKFYQDDLVFVPFHTFFFLVIIDLYP